MAKDQPVAKVMATLANVAGRNFSSLSVHPNSEEILFLEFKQDLPAVSKLLRYHLKTKQLSYYELPKEFVTLDAAFSPSGKYIVMRRAPNVSGDENVKREAYASSEIVLMKADGSDLKAIPLSKGLKMSPVLSHDDKRIAYWRATQRPDGSKSFASRFDVWEVNLKTGEDKPFSGLHQFFEGGQLQYLKGNNQMLVGAGFPKNDPQMINPDGSRRSNLTPSTMYLFDKSSTLVLNPLMTEIESSRKPSSDVKGNLYFAGQRPRVSFFKKNPIDQSITQWDYPWTTMSNEVDVKVLPNGSAISFIFLYLNSPHRDYTQRGIALFDIEQETWTQVSIPAFESAKLFTTKSLPR